MAVEKRKMATFDANDDKSTLAKLEPNALDDWDKQAVEYHDQYAKNNSSPYGYGYSDLSYYGAYQNIPGYGMLWQPYFSGIGWDPFMDGAWSWYPGFGYMFVSAYPWGWMPYYYGNWMFVPGYGWMWQPGYWNGWVGTPRVTGALPPHYTALVAPKGAVRTVVVGKGGPVVSSSTTTGFVRSGSAGLGIARGSVSNLSHLNREVAKAGFAEVRSAPQFAATGSHAGFGGYGGHSSASVASGGHVSSAGSMHSSSGGGGHVGGHH